MQYVHARETDACSGVQAARGDLEEALRTLQVQHKAEVAKVERLHSDLRDQVGGGRGREKKDDLYEEEQVVTGP